MAAIPSNVPRATPGGPVMALGQYRQIISAVGATRTLAPEESGALCLFDSAAGVVYTLPPPSAQTIGMQFEFLTSVTITSNSAKVLTDATTSFMVGGAALVNSGAATGEFFAANGTTHRSINGNGSTTGGIIGDRIRVTCISATVWAVDAVMNQTSTAATPFATS
jgi:hypothetical protein